MSDRGPGGRPGRLLAATALLVSAACASSRPEPGPDMSAVREFDRLQRLGALDVARVECAAAALLGDVEVWYAGLPSEEEMGEREEDVMADHARAVQESMRGAERGDAMAASAAMASKQAANQARAKGDPRATARAFSRAAALRRGTNHAAPRLGLAPVLPETTREAAAIFVLYVRVRGALALEEDGPSELLERSRALEEEYPELVPAYATVLLEAYRAPDLECTTSPG